MTHCLSKEKPKDFHTLIDKIKWQENAMAHRPFSVAKMQQLQQNNRPDTKSCSSAGFFPSEFLSFSMVNLFGIPNWP